jgi:hypothetical protein
MSDSPVCPNVAGCELYPRFSLKGALRIWQERYCNHPTQYQRCERYRRACSGEPILATLLPNGEQIPT